MPELPEVETIRRQAENTIIGRKICAINIRKDKLWIGDAQKVLGKKFVNIKRVGKYLLFYLEDGVGLVVHLKMTGRLVWNDSFYETAPHTRIIIDLDNDDKLYYWDTRMFGYVKVEPKLASFEKALTNKLGPEVWMIESKNLLAKIKKTRRSIKDVILDQSILSGVGNIYANDGLWDAQIDPLRVASELGVLEIERLLESLRKVLERGLALGGASDNTFRNFEGGMGHYQEEFLVYGRTNEPCYRCNEPLQRIVVSGRGTWVCTKCQSKSIARKK